MSKRKFDDADAEGRPNCTGCRSGRCIVHPLRQSSSTAGAGWAYRPGKSPFARVERLSQRTWLVVEDDRFNEHPFMYIVVGTARIVLIDTGVGTGGSSSYAKFVNEWRLKELGEEAARLPLLVISTHVHFDHIGGHAGLAPPLAEALAASDHNRNFTRAAFDPASDSSLALEVGCTEIEPFEVTRWLADGEIISLDGSGSDGNRGSHASDAILHVIHTPGHTPDSLCLWLEPEQILFVGDTIYPWASIIVSNQHSNLSDYMASLARLMRFLRERGALPAPGSTSTSAMGDEGTGSSSSASKGVRAASDSAATPLPILACGHVAADLPANALETVLQLARDAAAGKRAPSSSSTSRVATYERDEYALTVRTDDEALRLVPT